jgi:hypothetical protein
MANCGRLRPADTVLPEYLENPFPEADTKNHCPPLPRRLPSAVHDFRALPFIPLTFSPFHVILIPKPGFRSIYNL